MRVDIVMYSVLGETKELPWFAEMLGTFRICLVLKSFRSMRAMRPWALSLMKSQRPSYSPPVSEKPGWCESPQLYSPSISLLSSSKPYPVPG